MTGSAIIREGDPTSHGGTVLGGFPNLNVYGKSAAGVGHRGYCPQCKRDFVIVVGAKNFDYLGRRVAVEGMLTSCGATLIATQHQATIDLGPVGRAGEPDALGVGTGNPTSSAIAAHDLECYFLAQQDDGSAANLVYRIDADGSKLHEGRLDPRGATKTLPVVGAGEPIFWTPVA